MTASPETVTPALRFPEFRNTKEWDKFKLIDIFSFIRGKMLSKSDMRYKGKNRCIHYGQLFTTYKEVIDTVESYTDMEIGVFSRHGDLLMPLSTTTQAIDLAKASAILLEEVLLGGDILVLRPKSTTIESVFFAYYLTHGKKNQISMFGQGVTIVHTNTKHLREYRLSIPSHSEQQRIADCLSSIDELIAIAEQKLQTLRDHKQGLMQQLFLAAGETHPALRFPEFRDAPGWEEKPLNEICDGIHQGGTPDTSNPDYWDGDLPWLTPAEMGNLKSRFVNSTKRNLSHEGLRNCSSKLLPINSIILSTRAPIGYLAINLVEMAFNQGCRALVPSKQLVTDFLYYYLTTKETELNNLGAGSTFKELTGSILRNLKLAIPNTAEQQKIADCLSSVDSLIANAEERLDTLRNHKQGLMQQLFPSTKAKMHG